MSMYVSREDLVIPNVPLRELFPVEESLKKRLACLSPYNPKHSQNEFFWMIFIVFIGCEPERLQKFMEIQGPYPYDKTMSRVSHILGTIER